MKTAPKAFNNPKSLPSQLVEATIDAFQLSRSSTTPSLETQTTYMTSTDVLTLGQAEVLLKCCPNTLRKQALAGKVHGRRVGHCGASIALHSRND